MRTQTRGRRLSRRGIMGYGLAAGAAAFAAPWLGAGRARAVTSFTYITPFNYLIGFAQY